MGHLSQGLACTVTTVKSHLPCATLSPFIPRMGLPSGLRAIHVVSGHRLSGPPLTGLEGWAAGEVQALTQAGLFPIRVQVGPESPGPWPAPRLWASPDPAGQQS